MVCSIPLIGAGYGYITMRPTIKSIGLSSEPLQKNPLIIFFLRLEKVCAARVRRAPCTSEPGIGYKACMLLSQGGPSYMAVMLNMTDFADGISFILHPLFPSYPVQSTRYTHLYTNVISGMLVAMCFSDSQGHSWHPYLHGWSRGATGDAGVIKTACFVCCTPWRSYSRITMPAKKRRKQHGKTST